MVHTPALSWSYSGRVHSVGAVRGLQTHAPSLPGTIQGPAQQATHNKQFKGHCTAQRAWRRWVRTTGGRPCRACCCGYPICRRAPWRRWLRFNHRSKDLHGQASGVSVAANSYANKDTQDTTGEGHLQARRKLSRWQLKEAGGLRALPFCGLCRACALARELLPESKLAKPSFQ